MQHTDYMTHYRQSIEEPGSFWDAYAQQISWFRPYDNVLDDKDPKHPRWFPGGRLNLCYNALDRHVIAGRQDHPALLWENPETQASEQWTFGQTLEEVQRIARMLKETFGVQPGDRVVIYMPMIPQAIAAMLACARIGAIHVVVFSGYPTLPLAQRILDSQPKVILTACCTQRGGRLIPISNTVDKALKQLSLSLPVIIWDRKLDDQFSLTQDNHACWRTILAHQLPGLPCEELDAEDDAFILYTAGSDGRPDGIVHKVGSYTVAINASMQTLYDCKKDAVFWSTSDIGWIVGHSYITYGPLLHGIPSLIYEGTPLNPDAGIWWKTAQKHKVSILFTAPTALRILRRYPQHWIDDADLSHLQAIFLAGERCDAEIQQWATQRFGIPIVDHYWQTESGWSITGLHTGLHSPPPHSGTAGLPCLGWNLDLVDEDGQPVLNQQEGYLLCKTPLPPGAFAGIWGSPERFERYWGPFPNHYATFDKAKRHEDGCYTLLGRHDRIVNIAGHRIAIASIEQALREHPDIAKVTGIATEDKIKTEAITCIVVLRQDITPDFKLKKTLKNYLRERLGGIAVPRDIEFVESLPTHSQLPAHSQTTGE